MDHAPLTMKVRGEGGAPGAPLPCFAETQGGDDALTALYQDGVGHMPAPAPRAHAYVRVPHATDSQTPCVSDFGVGDGGVREALRI